MEIDYKFYFEQAKKSLKRLENGAAILGFNGLQLVYRQVYDDIQEGLDAIDQALEDSIQRRRTNSPGSSAGGDSGTS